MYTDYHIYINSDAASDGHKGFVHNDATHRHPIKTTTEFAFAAKYGSLEQAIKANKYFNGILFIRLD